MRLAYFAPLALAGCMTAADGTDLSAPQVVDWNGSTVKISHHAFPVGNAAESPIVIKANSVCRAVGKRAQFGAFAPYGTYGGLHTYLCV